MSQVVPTTSFLQFFTSLLLLEQSLPALPCLLKLALSCTLELLATGNTIAFHGTLHSNKNRSFTNFIHA
jgi:hypothetical protein